MRNRFKPFIPLLIVLAIALPVFGQKTSKELFDYIQEARKIGIADTKIKENAFKAGWDHATIDQTYAIVKLLHKEDADGGEGSRMKSVQILPAGYRIGPGDNLQIVVWKEPDASVPDVVVRADGKITIPLLKEVSVVGMTPSELELELQAKLSKLIAGADVTVIPRQIRSMRIYLVGAVKREGPIPMTGPMTVLQAITEGGGINDYAKKKKIYILRDDNGRQTRLPFDYQAVLQGERIDQNILLRPGDTIVVPQ